MEVGRFSVEEIIVTGSGAGTIYWAIQSAKADDITVAAEIVELSSTSRALFDADVDLEDSEDDSTDATGDSGDSTDTTDSDDSPGITAEVGGDQDLTDFEAAQLAAE